MGGEPTAGTPTLQPCGCPCRGRKPVCLLCCVRDAGRKAFAKRPRGGASARHLRQRPGRGDPPGRPPDGSPESDARCFCCIARAGGWLFGRGDASPLPGMVVIRSQKAAASRVSTRHLCPRLQASAPCRPEGRPTGNPCKTFAKRPRRSGLSPTSAPALQAPSSWGDDTPHRPHHSRPHSPPVAAGSLALLALAVHLAGAASPRPYMWRLQVPTSCRAEAHPAPAPKRASRARDEDLESVPVCACISQATHTPALVALGRPRRITRSCHNSRTASKSLCPVNHF